jgi:hypothetical protein
MTKMSSYPAWSRQTIELPEMMHVRHYKTRCANRLDVACLCRGCRHFLAARVLETVELGREAA